MPRRILVALTLALSVALAPRPTHADDATEAKNRFEQARIAQDQGLQAQQRGDRSAARAAFARALSEFMMSERLSPNFSAAFNVGWCLEALEQYQDAYGAFVDAGALIKTPEHQRLHDQAVERVVALVPRLELGSQPPGAAIFIDREELGQYGTTPRRFATPSGVHRYILRLDGYRVATGTVSMIKGQQVTRNVRLERETARVTVRSRPSGAEIRVGSAEAPVAGRTPLELELPLGEARILASLAGHGPTSTTLSVRTGTSTPAELVLEPLPKPRGRVRVQTNVAAALVEIDAQEAGFTPVVLDLPEGPHALRVAKPGHQPWGTSFQVTPDATAAVDVTLEVAAPAEIHSSWSRALWISGGVGAAVAAGLGIHASSLAGRYGDSPSRGTLEDADRFALASDVAWISAAVVGVAGALVWLYEEASVPDASRGEVETARLGAEGSR